MYKVIISGRGRYSFYEASARENFGSCEVQVGKEVYMHKHGRLQEGDSETGKPLGEIKSIEEVIGKKKWMIKL